MFSASRLTPSITSYRRKSGQLSDGQRQARYAQFRRLPATTAPRSSTRRARLRGVYGTRQRDAPESPRLIFEVGRPKPRSAATWRINLLPHPHGIRIMSARTSEPISTGSADSMRTDLRFSPGPSFDLLSTRCGPRAFHQHHDRGTDYSCLQRIRCRTKVAEFSSAEMRPACSASSRLT